MCTRRQALAQPMLPLEVAPSHLVPQKGELVLQLAERNGNQGDRSVRVFFLVGAIFVSFVSAAFVGVV